MKTGALSKEEQLNIIKALQSSKSISEIATDLDRSEDIVQKYLEDVRQAVEEKPEPIAIEVNKKIIDQVSHKLRQAGLTNVSINAKINKILKLLTPEQIKNLTVEALTSDCLRLVNVSDVMINKTASGNSGVAVMTEAGSERGDEVQKPPRPQPHVYKIY